MGCMNAPAANKSWSFTETFIGSDVSRTTADRKSTRLNSSHLVISYAVFCLKKKTICAWTSTRWRWGCDSDARPVLGCIGASVAVRALAHRLRCQSLRLAATVAAAERALSQHAYSD